MFKQQKQRGLETDLKNYQIKQKEENNNLHRQNRIGIKLISHSIQESTVNIYNRLEKQAAQTSTNKSNQPINRNSSVKGIQVLSSRQSSNQRKPMATSRSHERQKQSREIKSQTNISEFQSKNQSKQASIEKRSPSNAPSDHMTDLCRVYEDKFNEAILKSRSVFQLQLNELKEIISSNEERINNLIETINFMEQKSAKKQKIIEKLEQRLQSLINYNQQCYVYTVNRVKQIESAQHIIVEEIQLDNAGICKVENWIQNIQLIMKNIFLIQRYSSKKQLSFACEQINKFQKGLIQIQNKLINLNHQKNMIQNRQIKQVSLVQYLGEMSRMLTQKKVFNQTCFEVTQKEFYSNQQQSFLKYQLDQLHLKINELQSLKDDMERNYLLSQQKAQKTISQLSNLLHKQQRESQRRKKQVEQLTKYNIQLQNKLIESRLKESNLRLDIEQHYKQLEVSKRQQINQMQKEKDVFKQRFQQLFRQNQYLQDQTCKNKLMIKNQQQAIQSLNKTIQSMGKWQLQVNMLKLELEQKQRNWKSTSNSQMINISTRLLQRQLEIEKLKIMEKQNAEQIRLLQTQVCILTNTNNNLQNEKKKIQDQLVSVQMQLRNEQLYTEDLQIENEQLSNSLNQYKAIFQQQSKAFKNTIQNLKHENLQLHHTLEAKSEQIFMNQPKKYEQSVSVPLSPLMSTSKVIRLSMTEKLSQLKKIFEYSGWEEPVPCEMDSSGYLKHYDQGTYIIDSQENAFELSAEEVNMAVRANLIRLK